MTFEEKRKAINDLRNMAIPEYSPLYSSINLAIEAIANYDSVKTELEPCEDAISRQAMHIELEKWITYGEYKYSNATQYLYDRIDRLPPVNPAEKVGQWIYEGYYKCSECGKTTYSHKTNYCPNCGAKMQEVEE